VIAGTIADEGTFRRLLGESGLFQEAWYRTRYPDVEMAGIDALAHYLRFGMRLRRRPGPGFDPVYYAAANPDLPPSGMDPLCHYLLHGRAEGRSCSPPGEGASGNGAMQDVAGTRLLGHIDRIGHASIEGWAVDELQPGRPIELVLHVDGARVLAFSTVRPRNDVCAKGIRGEAAGFAVHVPPGLLRCGQVIEVRDPMGARGLSGGPAAVGLVSSRGQMPTPVYLPAVMSNAVRPVSVVVPVFNSPEVVAECLASLASCAMPTDSEVLMLDDGSNDPRIPEVLDRYKQECGFRLERNPVNLGYTKTVNRALELCAGRDVVLLNSDTRVTPRWLHALRYCAYSQPDIGTVTALSDNAGAFSVPEIGVANPPPPGLAAADAALAVVQAGEGRPIDVPTGNGFCLYLRRDALDQVGGFDEAKYPCGYGEENDLCMRLLYAGWRNVICDKAYVFHLRSQSFGDRKRLLVEQGARQLAVDYPEYRGLIARFGDIEFVMRRARIGRALERAIAHPPRPRILYVISTATGGTPQTNLDLMRAMSHRYECFLLRSDSLTLTLSHLQDGELVQIEAASLHFPVAQVPHRSSEYDRIVADMLYRYSIDMLHVRHVAWHGLGIAEAAAALDIPVVYSVHDFYSLCPSVNLLDAGHRYRGIDTGGERINPLWPASAVPDGFIPRWRKMMDGFLGRCAAFVTTSRSAVDLFSDTYPEHARRMHLIPHGRDFAEFAMPVVLAPAGGPLRVLAPGNISVSKGARLLAEIHALDRDDSMELHFLGNAVQEVKHAGTHHGSYERDQFQAKVQAIAPHVGVVLSIWPETFCHTLTEMWACGIPVLGLDVGAVGDRIRAVGGGWLLPVDAGPAEILRKLQQIAADPTEITARRAEIARWQAGEAQVQDTAHMAAEYRQVYWPLLRPAPGRLLKVGLVTKLARRKGPPPTAHIRLLRPLAAAARTGRIDPRPISVEALLAGASGSFDVVVVQRDAVPARQAERLVQALEAAGVPWVFEMDDMLWDLPEDNTDHEIDAAAVAAMRAIARGAWCVTTSTQPLAAALATANARVEVIPNALDERLWCPPPSQALVDEVSRELGLVPGCRYLLYMGSRSHAKDLEMIVPPLERILERYPDVRILQVGGGHPLPYAREVECPPRFAAYPDFVGWFRALARHCAVALAPLRGNAFNASKSDIKWLDYALAGIPAVYSDFGPYARTIRDGTTGLLCADSVQAWEHGIASLLESPELSERVRRSASAAAMDRTLMGSGVPGRWAAILEQAAASRQDARAQADGRERAPER
jgi:GT2 family glycosyltransferase